MWGEGKIIVDIVYCVPYITLVNKGVNDMKTGLMAFAAVFSIIKFGGIE